MIGLKVNTQFQISLLFGLHPFVIWLLYFRFQIFEVKVNSSFLMGLFLSFSVCFHYSLNHSEPENLTSLQACFFNLMQLKFNLWPQAIKILLFHPMKDRAFFKKNHNFSTSRFLTFLLTEFWMLTEQKVNFQCSGSYLRKNYSSHKIFPKIYCQF